MVENRAEWQRRIEESIGANSAIDEAKKIEDLTRWKRRATAFEEIALPLIEQATKQANDATAATQDPAAASDPTLPAHAQYLRGGRVSHRRSTIRMFEDMSRTLAKSETAVLEGGAEV